MNSLLVCIFAGLIVGGATKLAIDAVEYRDPIRVISFYGISIYLFGLVMGGILL